jgi:hypothetical protein
LPGRTSSIGADRGDDGIWIYGLAGSFIVFIRQITSVHRITLGQIGRRLRNIIAAARSSSDLQDPDILEAFCEQRLG